MLVSDDSVYEYEKHNLPEGAWPPTTWYADWVSGLDVVELLKRNPAADRDAIRKLCRQFRLRGLEPLIREADATA